MTFRRNSNPSSDITCDHVRDVISLARNLPEHRPLSSGDAHFQIVQIGPGVVIRRTLSHVAMEAAQELIVGGERIAVVWIDAFHLFSLTPWLWWVDRHRHSRPVELLNEKALRLMAVPGKPKGLTTKAVQLLFGRHVFDGVTAADLDELARQLRLAAAVE